LEALEKVHTMPNSHPAFLCGERVNTASLEVLREFTKDFYRLHHAVTPEQLAYADHETNIVAIEEWHGGGIIYRLKDVPGLWLEAVLRDSLLDDEGWANYPRPNHYYNIDTMVLDGYEYVVVTTKDGTECLRRFSHPFAFWEAENMRQVARLRHLTGFHIRYNFNGPWGQLPRGAFLPRTEEELEARLADLAAKENGQSG
jgi:hypothetical protein